MGLADALRFLNSQSDGRLRWRCGTRSQIFDAAFELHELAVRAGFAPDEATKLSLTLAELSTPVADETSEATVSLSPQGWHLEVSAPEEKMVNRMTAADRTQVRTERRAEGRIFYSAEYRRPSPRVRANALRTAMTSGVDHRTW